MQPWERGETPEEAEAREAALRRLSDAARRVGMSLAQLAALLGQVSHNEQETRRFLSDEVYGVPDDALDEYLRVRLADLDDERP